jgi:microcystin-dependent protein
LAGLLSEGCLPDFRGRVLIAAGEAATVDGTNYAAQTNYGNPTHTLTSEEMPSHQHYGWGAAGQKNNIGYYGMGFGASSKSGYLGDQHDADYDNYLYGSTFAGGTGNTSLTISLAGGGVTYTMASDNSAFDLLQPSYALNFYIYAGTPKG